MPHKPVYGLYNLHRKISVIFQKYLLVRYWGSSQSQFCFMSDVERSIEVPHLVNAMYFYVRFVGILWAATKVLCNGSPKTKNSCLKDASTILYRYVNEEYPFCSSNVLCLEVLDFIWRSSKYTRSYLYSQRQGECIEYKELLKFNLTTSLLLSMFHYLSDLSAQASSWTW